MVQKVFAYTYPSNIASNEICGIDEVGRGPLVGPVVAACVIIDENKIPAVDDSKRLSEQKRQELSLLIKEQAYAYGIGVVNSDEIDRINILQASLKAMRLAYENMSKSCKLALVDGNKLIPNLNIEQQCVIKGDSKVYQIACASILAKVYRDNLMYELDQKYPQYKFAQHKGYPTALHLEIIKQYGVLDCYRRSFKPVKMLLEG